MHNITILAIESREFSSPTHPHHRRCYYATVSEGGVVKVHLKVGERVLHWVGTHEETLSSLSAPIFLGTQVVLAVA